MFQPARPKRAVDQIVAQIDALLREGRLRPGDRLPSERALAAQFDVSRNTVREGLRILEFTGALVLKRGSAGGTFVAHFDLDAAVRGVAESLDRAAFPHGDLVRARDLVTAAAKDDCRRGAGNPVLGVFLRSLEDVTARHGGEAPPLGQGAA
jgi:DNA-binding FadR family transcriptional regulator